MMGRVWQRGATGICFWLLWLSTLVAAEPPAGLEFPPELVNWEPASDSPVFTGAGPGHWDELIRERGWIIKDEDTWHLWYSGYQTDDRTCKLGYATSPDGKLWQRAVQHPIYDTHWVEDMQVHKAGGRYLMFAEGLDDQAQLLTSRDGLHWLRQGTLDIRLTDGEPIPPGPFGTPSAWHENDVWYLFYERRDLGVWLAKSTDLKTWHNVQDDPVITLGPGKYDSQQIAVNQILKYKDRYYALYHGSGSTTKPSLWTTNIAVSTDLVHWKKYPQNPLLPESVNRSSGILVNDGEKFRLYTMHPNVNLYLPKKTK